MKYYFDEAAGERVINFTERYCRHVKGHLRGQLIKLEDWQKQIIRDVFGWKRKSDDKRRYSYIYIEVPKKNGKSTMLAPISLYLLGWDGEPGAEIFGAAADREQARIVFDTAREMVEMSEELQAELDVYRYRIDHQASGSWYKVVSAEAPTKHGPNLHGIMFDEIAVQPNENLYDTLRKGIASRLQPMLWMITTAQVKETFGHSLHRYAKDVMNGVIEDDRWYVRIYGATEDDDPFDPKVWAKTNPSLGKALPTKYFEEEVQEVKNDPSKMNAFKRLHLNVWTGTTQSWHIADIWDTCNFGEIDTDELKGRPCYGGLDLAYIDDMNAFALFWPPTEQDRGVLKVWFWIPGRTVEERAKRQHHQFIQWVKDERVFTQMEDVIQISGIAEDVLEITEGHQLRGIGYDRLRADDAVRKFEEAGIPCYPFAQGAKTFNLPIEEFQKLVTLGDINHMGCPVLSWQINNVQLKEDSNGGKWVHKTASTGKIDGIVATLNAVCAWMHLSIQPEKPEPYADRDIFFV